MNFIQRVGIALRAFNSPNKFNQAFFWGIGSGYTAYDYNNKNYLEQGFLYNPTVFSVINQQAVKSASIPLYVKKIKDKKQYQKLNNLRLITKGDQSIQQKIKTMVLETKAFDDEDLPLPLETPNPYQTWIELRQLMKMFLKTTGNVYLYMLAPEEGVNAGKPIALYVLPSHLIQIIIKDKINLLGVDDPVKEYILTEGDRYITFKAENVIHIKYPNPDYGTNGEHLYGLSPLKAALRNIQSSNTGLNQNIKTLKNGGAFGFIHAKQQALTVDQAKELKERLLEMDANPDNLGKIAGVSAEVGFTRISLATDELKPFDFLKFDEKQICNVLVWSDKSLNNDDGAKYDNADIYQKWNITNNIVPDNNLIAEALNRYFLPRFKGYENTIVEFDISDLPEMQDNLKDLVQWLVQLVNTGIINKWEARDVLRFSNMDVPEELKIFTVQNDIMTLTEAIDNTFSIGNQA